MKNPTDGSNAHLLFVEPATAPSASPIIDDLTRKMAGALRIARLGSARYRGVHMCTSPGCNATSDNADHYVAIDPERLPTLPGAMPPSEVMTNSLAVHYLAHHRDAIDHRDLLMVGSLVADQVEPTAHELAGRPVWDDPRDPLH